MFRYDDSPVLDPDFDTGGFDDVIARARCGRVASDELYGEYTNACQGYVDRKAEALRERERVERELRAAMERRTVEAERFKVADMERQKQRARELYFRTEKDRIRREMVDVSITLPIYDKDEWERVIAAHNAWLASW